MLSRCQKEEAHCSPQLQVWCKQAAPQRLDLVLVLLLDSVLPPLFLTLVLCLETKARKMRTQTQEFDLKTRIFLGEIFKQRSCHFSSSFALTPFVFVMSNLFYFHNFFHFGSCSLSFLQGNESIKKGNLTHKQTKLLSRDLFWTDIHLEFPLLSKAVSVVTLRIWFHCH